MGSARRQADHGGENPSGGTGRGRRKTGAGGVPAAILAQQRAAGNRAVAAILGRRPTVQRQPPIDVLPTEMSLAVLGTISWRDFVKLRTTNKAYQQWIDGLVANWYGGQWSAEGMLKLWLLDIRKVRELNAPQILNLAATMGEQALWAKFWRTIALAQVPDRLPEPATALNVDIMLALGEKFGMAGNIDFVTALVDLAYYAGVDHLSFLESYLDALQAAQARQGDPKAAKDKRTELERDLGIVLGAEDDKGAVFYDTALSSYVEVEDGYQEANEFLLNLLKQDSQESDYRKAKVLAQRLEVKLRELDKVLGTDRGKPSPGDAPPALLKYLKSALPQAEWEILLELHTELLTPPNVSIGYAGCRAAIAQADDLFSAVMVLLDVLETARDADENRKQIKQEQAAKKGPELTAHEKKTADRWARWAAAKKNPVPNTPAPVPAAAPGPAPYVDPDADGRTGTENNLTYRGAAYVRFGPMSYGRVDRTALARDFTDPQLAAFDAALAHGLALQALGVSGVKQRGPYYQVKLSDQDARLAGLTGSAEGRLRSALAIVDTTRDQYGIRYFVFDRKDTSHGGGHI